MVALANCIASASAALDDDTRMSACVMDVNTRLAWYLKTVQRRTLLVEYQMPALLCSLTIKSANASLCCYV